MADNQESEDQSNLPERVEKVVTWAAALGGGVHSIVDPITGAFISASSPQIGELAAVVVADVQRRVGFLHWPRVFDGWSRTRRGMEERGVHPDPEQVGDLIIESARIFADAVTEEKRQTIANILVNAANCKGLAERAQAVSALDIIRQLTDDAVIIFSFIASEIGDAGMADGDLPPSTVLPFRGTYYDLPWVMVYPAVDRELKEKWQFVSTERGRDAQGEEILKVFLLERGQWLRDWIKAHPTNTCQATKGKER